MYTLFSQVMKEDDNNWPEPDRVGRQELEIVMGNEHISFTTAKIGSLLDVQTSKDPEGLRIFYYLVQVRESKGRWSLWSLQPICSHPDALYLHCLLLANCNHGTFWTEFLTFCRSGFDKNFYVFHRRI